MGQNPMPAIILIVVLVGIFLVIRFGVNAAANKANDAISNKWSRYKNAKEPQGRELLADRYRGVANLGIVLPPPGTPAPLPGTRGRAQAVRAATTTPAQAAARAVPQATKAASTTSRSSNARAAATPAGRTAPAANVASGAPAASPSPAPKRAFCPKCGKELPPDAKFCGACGEAVRKRAPQGA